METLKIILLSMGGTSFLIIAVGFLSKKILSHFLAKDIEDYKLKIKQENEIRLAELKVELETNSKNEERYIQKLEELHQSLTEIFLHIYVKYSNICEMINDGRSFEEVNQYVAYHNLTPRETDILQSRVKSLSLIYAKNLNSDVTDRIAALMDTINKFYIKHSNGKNTLQDLNQLKGKVEEFGQAASEHMKKICNEIQSRI